MEINLDVLKKMVVIEPDIYICTGSRQLKPKDIGLDISTLPPEKLATLGKLHALPKDVVQPLYRTRQRIREESTRCGVRFMRGWGQPNERMHTLVPILDKLCAEGNKHADYLRNNIDSIIDAWCEENPTWEALIRASRPSMETLQKVVFDYRTFRVTGCEIESTDADRGLSKEVTGLANQLLTEIAQAAHETWEKSFKGKSKVTRRALRGFKAIIEKLEALSFLDEKLLPIADRIRAALSQVPKTGPIENNDLNGLSGLLLLLSDTETLIQEGAAALVEGKNQGQLLIPGVAGKSPGSSNSSSEDEEDAGEVQVAPRTVAGLGF